MTTSTNFASPNGLAMPTGGLAQRRGSQGIKPLSFDAIKQGNNTNDTGIPTPRTSRSHLLAGLRTAPKSATAASFGPASPTTTGPQQFTRSNAHGNSHSSLAQEAMYNSAPKTAFPQYGVQQNQYQNMMNQQYTVDQVLAPPELSLDDQAQEQMDPNLYAQLVATNMYLAQQQQRLQQQLRNVQAAAQQFQQLNLSNPHLAQQQMAVYEQQQQHLRNMQHQLSLQTSLAQAQAQAQVQAHAQAQVQAQAQQFYYNPMTGQYFVDTSAAQMVSAYAEQPMSPGFSQQQHLMMQQQQQQGTPRVQVSPPPENQSNMFRSNSPPKRYESPVEVTPLPPPSANAFRRSHKKLPSVTPINSEMAANASVGEGPRSAGPKSALFPNPGGYGPGQARAGEHPIRQPRGPPSMDELKAKPTAKHEGSKNFASRTRRSAVHNLVRAGLVRRKGTGSSTGSMSPVSESAEDAASTPITDNESDSGRSGSGSLAGEMESNSSRTSASGGWGAIGSDRPSSRQKARNSVDSATSGCESDTNSFAHVFKNGAVRSSKSQESADGQRKASRLVLTSVEKRKATPTAV
ncbi:hypothetical protein B0I35DRAFT_474503 [Stachybotrys elegans]|uniref:Uncharacterized protein n=1 Tax=Stachybotrys elegans TaxID=80388 RepID=A0A8K0T3D7_9HYPO|nr:hypothetical protein B0I35DRAFT_474503 [Stachybotrys elegans]